MSTAPPDLGAIIAEHQPVSRLHRWCEACTAERWPCLPYRLAALAQEQAAALASAWDEGRQAEFNAGGRHAEPINPYRAALAGEQS